MRDTIEMARESGLEEMWEFTTGFTKRLKAFEALVRADEREEIAQFIENTRLGSLPIDIATHYARLLGSYATAIRARGETK